MTPSKRWNFSWPVQKHPHPTISKSYPGTLGVGGSNGHDDDSRRRRRRCSSSSPSSTSDEDSSSWSILSLDWDSIFLSLYDVNDVGIRILLDLLDRDSYSVVGGVSLIW